MFSFLHGQNETPRLNTLRQLSLFATLSLPELHVIDGLLHERRYLQGEIIFDEGEEVWAKAGRNGCRFLFAHGEPLRESIAWGGPIVMNTEKELERSFEELRSGKFIR